MRIRTILVVAALYAVPACGQRIIKTECHELNGSNQFVGPDETIVPVGDGYQVCHAVKAKPTPEATPRTQEPVQVEKVPVVVAPTAQLPAQADNISVQNFADIDNKEAASACKSRPDSTVVSIQTGSTLSCSDWLAIRAAKLGPGSATPPAAAQPTPEIVARPEPQPMKQSSVKTVTFAVANHGGGVEYYVPDWVQKWVSKHAKKYPGILFTQQRAVGNKSYLIVLSDSAYALSGFEPVTHTSTSTSSSTTPVSGSGTVTSNYGDTWNYTYNGTATTNTTTTTQTTENEAYTIQSNTLYATAFDSHGGTVSKHWHVYSTKSGGDAYNSLGYNLGNAFRAIDARGRLLGDVAKDIEGSR